MGCSVLGSGRAVNEALADNPTVPPPVILCLFYPVKCILYRLIPSCPVLSASAKLLSPVLPLTFSVHGALRSLGLAAPDERRCG
jgi:hypothetical protein